MAGTSSLDEARIAPLPDIFRPGRHLHPLRSSTGRIQILGTSVNGLYAAAVKISEFSYILPAMLCVALYPMLSRDAEPG